MEGVTGEHVLVITGPTASGKTDYALQLAECDPSIEIVNADASLLYREFDIGTAKPAREMRERIPHHLIDILKPKEFFSAADFSKAARTVIRDILCRNKKPIVVGGNGFYLDALFEGIMSIEIDEAVMKEAKERVKFEFESEGFDAMHERLREVDPILYAQIQRERNPLRLFRAWEHHYATGEPLGEARQRKAEPFERKAQFHVLNVPREELWQRIERRVDAMLDAGWLDEAKRLKASGVTREMSAMRAIGYRELFDVIEKIMSITEARDRIIFRTRQYAKRQSTWMKRYTDPPIPNS